MTGKSDSVEQTIEYPDGTYIGEVSNGVPTGRGTFTWSDGDKYVGEFKDNKFHGQGTWVHPNGRKYVGEYKDDEFHGQGTFTFPDGRKYVGELKDGERSQGKEYDKGGKEISVYWRGFRIPKFW